MDLREISDWFESLHPTFVFLLAMPVAVAFAGLARYWFDEWRSRVKGPPSHGYFSCARSPRRVRRT